MALENEQYRLLLENLPDACVSFQMVFCSNSQVYEYYFLDANPAFETMTGLTKEEIIGKKVQEVFVGDAGYDPGWSDTIDGVAATGKTASFEHYSDLLGCWYEAIVFKTEDRSLAAVYRDITNKKNVKKELMEVVELFADIVNHANDLIQSVDQHGKFVFVNRAWKEKLGYTEEEIENLTMWDIIHPDSLEHCQTVFQEIMSGRAVNNAEAVFLARDGTSIAVEGNVSCRFDAEKIRTRGIFRDITQRKQAEEESRKTEQKYREILSTIKEGYYEVDLAGNFVFFNDSLCDMLGYERHELMHESYKKIFSNPAAVFETYNRVYRTGKPEITASRPVITQDGREFFAEFSIVLRLDESGNPIGFRGIAKDVTERKYYEEKLKYLSLHDQLTGLYNRAFFEEEMKRFAGSREYPITLISADLDELKLINDTMGHARGDELLQACAEVLRRSLCSSDILARMGGDEFAVLLPRTDRAVGEEIAKRIQSNTAQHNRERPTLPVSISLGVAAAASSDISLEETYKKADDLMFREKRANRDDARSKIIDSFLAALEKRNHPAGGRAERLSALCRAVGERLGLPPTRLVDLHLLARAHDLGKVTVPESIFFKKGPLSEKEQATMRQHPEKGCTIAKSSPELACVADLILKHHERWDGQGYPLSLKGEEIPLECRIFAIANAFDAMTGDRPHREKRSKEEALQELQRCAGTQFDPELVELFLKEVGNKPS